MEFIKTYRREDKPVVFLFSEPNVFSLYVLEDLLANFCDVCVLTNKEKDWKETSKHLKGNPSFKIYSEKEYTKVGKANYFLFVDLTPDNLQRLKDGIQTISRSLGVKGFLLTSKNVSTHLSKSFDLGDSLGIIYLSDLIGPRMELNISTAIGRLLLGAIGGKKITVSQNEKCYVINLKDAAKQVVRWLFSFGPYGEEVLITSRERGIAEISQIIKRYYPGFEVVFSDRPFNNTLPKGIKTVLINTNLERALADTVAWLKSSSGSKYITQNKVKRVKKRVFRTNRKVVLVLKSLVVLAITPFILIGISFLFLLLAKASFDKGNLRNTQFFAFNSNVVSNVASTESQIFSGMPLVGRLYAPASSFSYILKTGTDIVLKGIGVLEESSDLVGKVLGESDYDVNSYSQKIYSDFDFMNTSLSFLEGDLKNYPILFQRLGPVLSKNYIAQFRNISLSIPELLGSDAKKTYLILFENNMELRPTGGFIGSFALASFEKGKLTDLSVQDVYSADGQLRGHIEPPAAVKKYLNEANWFLRDSNWDPDFPTSAQRAEWFLDKEISVPVDGVIAIDLNLAKDVLKLTGPINLTDYQMQISSDNLYEKTQGEAEENFFAGSTQKASFLAALSKEIVARVTSMPGGSYNALSQIIFNNLEERHIQIFLHNSSAEKALSGLGWDGSFSVPACQDNCFSDFLGLVEANLGVNKANYFVTRNYKLSVSLASGNINKTLSITFTNAANAALGNSGIYKNYFRVYLPTSAYSFTARSDNNQLQADIDTSSGKVVLGYYIEVLPGQKKEFTLSWQEPLTANINSPGSYMLFIRKQAGLDAEPFSINYSLPKTGMKIEPGASLTAGGAFVYNTLFLRDILQKVSW